MPASDLSQWATAPGAEPRIRSVESPSGAAAEALAKAWPYAGEPPHLMTALAHHPDLLRRFSALGGVFGARSTLPPRVRELVILRVAVRTGCRYEWVHHLDNARQAGIGDEELAGLAETTHPGDRPGQDADVLRFVDELLDAADVGDRTWLRLARTWSSAQLVELLLLVGFYRLAAGFLNAARIPVEQTWPPPPAGSGPEGVGAGTVKEDGHA